MIFEYTEAEKRQIEQAYIHGTIEINEIENQIKAFFPQINKYWEQGEPAPEEIESKYNELLEKYENTDIEMMNNLEQIRRNAEKRFFESFNNNVPAIAKEAKRQAKLIFENYINGTKKKDIIFNVRDRVTMEKWLKKDISKEDALQMLSNINILPRRTKEEIAIEYNQATSYIFHNLGIFDEFLKQKAPAEKEELNKYIYNFLKSSPNITISKKKRKQPQTKANSTGKERKIPASLQLLEIEEKAAKYKVMRQEAGINSFTSINPARAEIEITDPTFSRAEIKQEEKIAYIDAYEENLIKLRVSAYQLLRIILIIATSKGFKEREVTFNLNTFMQLRGLKDRKEARKQIKNDLALIGHTSIPEKGKQGNKIIDYGFINIAERGKIERNGKITFKFTESYFDIISKAPILQYSETALKINSGKNPYSFFLSEKLQLHKRMNAGKPNENIISVKSLLKAAGFPTPEQVSTTNRNYTARIIEPFERDLAALEDDFTFEYCNSGGKPLTEEEKANFDYGIFESSLIKIIWKDYPDQKHLIDPQKKQREKANNTRENKR